MSGSELIGERIRVFASATDDSDWADVLRRAGLDEPREHSTDRSRAGRLLRRRWLVLALAMLVLVTAGATFAAVHGLPWWESGAPPIDPQAVVAVARDNMPANVDTTRARTAADTGGAALVAVPLDQTGYCLIPVLDRRADIGAQCEYQVKNPAQGDDDLLRGYAQPEGRPGGPAWIVYGRITDPRAATLDLSAAAGVPFTIDLQPGGFFLASIPTDRWSTLAKTAGQGQILDASGTTLRSGCVNWGPSPNSTGAGNSDTILWSDQSGTCKAQPAVPPTPTMDLSKAHKVVELTLVSNFGIFKQGSTIALWQAPASNGNVCVFLAKADEPPTPGLTGNNPSGGGDCSQHGTPQGPAPTAVNVTFSATRLPNGDYSEILDGHTYPGSDITKLELHGAGNAIPVALADGWFLVELPDSHTVNLPAGGPWLLIGYDKNGNQISTLNLNHQQAQSEPH